jgi:hypothetical protein
VAGTEVLAPYMALPAAANLKLAPLDRATPLAAAVLLVGVTLHSLDGHARPHERWSTSNERPSQALLRGYPPPPPNTRIRPLTRPYPCPHFLFTNTAPSPLSGEHVRVSSYEKASRTGRARNINDRVWIFLFPKVSVQSFPAAIDHADRRCRYLV